MNPETRVAAVAALLRVMLDVQTAAHEVAKHVKQAEGFRAFDPGTCLGAMDGVDNAAVVDTVERQRVAAGLATWTTTLRQTVKAAEAAWLEHGEVFYGECPLRRGVSPSPAETLGNLLNALGVGREDATEAEKPGRDRGAGHAIETAVQMIADEVKLLRAVHDSIESKPYPSPLRVFADRHSQPAQWVRSEIEIAWAMGTLLIYRINLQRPECDGLWRRYDSGQVIDRDKWERERKARAALVRDEVYPQLFAFCDRLNLVLTELPRIAPLVDSPSVPPADRFTVRAAAAILNALRAVDAGSIVELHGQKMIGGCPTGNLRNYSGLGAALEGLAALMPDMARAAIAEGMSPARPSGGGGAGLDAGAAEGGRADAKIPATTPPAQTVAGAERAAIAPAVKLPKLKTWALTAWQLRQSGRTVSEIALMLAQKHKDKRITQPRVSEQIKLAVMHAEASGLADAAARAFGTGGHLAPARTADPSVADQGRRTDGRAAHLRQKAEQHFEDD